jgi:hypothetical protein
MQAMSDEVFIAAVSVALHSRKHFIAKRSAS